MNLTQFLNLFVAALAAATATEAQKWGIDPGTWQKDLAEWATMAVTGLTAWINHSRHSAANTSSGAAKASALFVVGALALSLGACGCASGIVNVPGGKVVSVSTRCLGVMIETTDTTTQTPRLYLGYVSSQVQLIPTGSGTNGCITTPTFANAFNYGNTGFLSFDIGEAIATGNYELLSPGSTNSAPTIVPMRSIPAPVVPAALIP